MIPEVNIAMAGALPDYGMLGELDSIAVARLAM